MTHWFIERGGQKLGPLAAADIARMMDSGELDWASPIWREGLPDWCPIQSDHALTTALLAVRGAFADTHVFPAPPGLRADDTVVDPIPAPQVAVKPLGTPGAPTPAAAITSAEPPPAEPAPALAALPREAPSDTGSHQPVVPRSPVPHSWMPSVRSMLLVAGLAFLFGVVVAALWGRLLRRTPAREEIVVPTLRLGEAREPAPSAHPSPPREPAPPAPPLAELSSEALRNELRRVSADVHRCLTAPAEGVQVDATIEGSTGRVRDVRITAGKLSAGVHTCVVQAVKQIELPPFQGEPHKLSHRFVW